MNIHKINVGRLQGLLPAPRSKKEAASMELEDRKKEYERDKRLTYIIYTVIPGLALLGIVAVLYFLVCLWLAAFGVL